MLGELGKRIKERQYHRCNSKSIILLQVPRNRVQRRCFQKSTKGPIVLQRDTIPGYYNKPEKKYGVRKSTTYKGKPHSSHARIEKRKHLIRNKSCTLLKR
ncbi:hypothetical protein C4D60_Mb03t15440 [Musa balbisiana]|uniref:Uncharacterized protein n=1 Tax=Musa balbisiana TaxID=52838 RepID=A0A4S8JA67_MUSBA|nr:hypothetical protein C4D60_Mb03t15440 [Musa balbisiana]